MDKLDFVSKAIFNASIDDKDTIFEFKETCVLLKNYLKDKKAIKDFKKIYFSPKGFEECNTLNRLLENKYGISFHYAQQFDKDDVRVSIKLKDEKKYTNALMTISTI